MKFSMWSCLWLGHRLWFVNTWCKLLGLVIMCSQPLWSQACIMDQALFSGNLRPLLNDGFLVFVLLFSRNVDGIAFKISCKQGHIFQKFWKKYASSGYGDARRLLPKAAPGVLFAMICKAYPFQNITTRNTSIVFKTSITQLFKEPPFSKGHELPGMMDKRCRKAIHLWSSAEYRFSEP